MGNSKSIRIYFLLFIFLSTLTFAAAGENGVDSLYENQSQNHGDIEMADVLRSNGMIYVVVGVILIVLVGLIIYLISVDRKIGKLEREVNESSNLNADGTQPVKRV